MTFNYAKLKGRIAEIFGKQGDFSEAMRWSKSTTSLKLNSIAEWRQGEILDAIKLLKLDETDIAEYFFDAVAKEKPDLMVASDEPQAKEDGQMRLTMKKDGDGFEMRLNDITIPYVEKYQIESSDVPGMSELSMKILVEYP